MNGKVWNVGWFVYFLWVFLWVEYLGLCMIEVDVIWDFVCDMIYKDFWMLRVKINLRIYKDVFGFIFDDVILFCIIFC